VRISRIFCLHKTSSLLEQFLNRFKVAIPEVFHIGAVPVKGARKVAAEGLTDFVPVSLRAGLCHLSMLGRERKRISSRKANNKGR
jgi:hypothetical protein